MKIGIVNMNSNEVELGEDSKIDSNLLDNNNSCDELKLYETICNEISFNEKTYQSRTKDIDL